MKKFLLIFGMILIIGMLAFNFASAADTNGYILNNVSDSHVNVEIIDQQNVKSIEDSTIDDNTKDINNDINTPNNQSAINNDTNTPNNQSAINNDTNTPNNQSAINNDSNSLILANDPSFIEPLSNLTIYGCIGTVAGSGGGMNTGTGAALSETGEDAIRLLEDLGVIDKMSYWSVKAFVKIYQAFDGRMTDDMAEWVVDFLVFHEHDLREEIILPVEKIVAKATSMFIHDISTKISSIFHWIF